MQQVSLLSFNRLSPYLDIANQHFFVLCKLEFHRTDLLSGFVELGPCLGQIVIEGSLVVDGMDEFRAQSRNLVTKLGVLLGAW